jgi:hypothetical protein
MTHKRKLGPVRNRHTEVCHHCGELTYAMTGRILKLPPFRGLIDNRTFHMECADRHLALTKGINPDQLSLFNEEGK